MSEDTIVTMTRTKRAWYAHPALLGEDEAQRLYGREEIGLHCYKVDKDGSREMMDGEVYLRWFEIDGKPSPHLQVFDDSWSLLPVISPILSKAQQALAEDNRGADAIEAFFKQLGVEDATEIVPKDPDTRQKFEQALAAYEQGNVVSMRKPGSP